MGGDPLSQLTVLPSSCPPPGDLDPADRCLALGPIEDGTLFRCTRQAGHDGRHRNQRTYPDKRWAVTYQPRVKDGELVGTYRPGEHPGPDPGRPEAAHSGSQAGVPTVDPEKISEISADFLPEDRSELWGSQANTSDTSGSAVKDAAQDEADDSGEQEPSQLPLCPAVDELDGLEEHECREWWVDQSDELDADVRHVCTQRPKTCRERPRSRSQRHECACGKNRTVDTHGTLEATSRPEQTLEEVAGS